MNNIDQIYKILNKETKKYRVPVVDLIGAQTRDPFKVLVTTIISARTKDQVTMKAVKKLFSKINNYKELKILTEKQIEKLIYPAGFYHTKARHLKRLGQVLEEKFEGRIPSTIEELIELPGVGRKTANLVLAVAFNKPAICVDTHVHRIMNRLGYIKTKTPLETEMTLRKKLPKKYWTTINSIIVAFGQFLCRPINPKCEVCPIIKYCEQIKIKKIL
jgi:endonuclease III